MISFKTRKSQRLRLSWNSSQLSNWAHKCHNRYERLPTNIESLVALLRKAELHPAVRNWTPGRLAANLIHKFRFDGIRYDRCVDTSTGALPLVLDLQSEVPKMALVWQFIEGKMVHNFHMSQIRSLDRVTIRHILIRDGGTGCAWALHGCYWHFFAFTTYYQVNSGFL